MKLLKTLLRKIFRRRAKSIFPNVENSIERVFTLEGVDYYAFTSTSDTACLRAIKVMTFYTELTMRVDAEYLDLHLEACDKIFNSTRVDIYKLKQYHDFLKERRKWIVDTDLVYKLASVVYFDASENPLDYDFEYNQKKIALWKRQAKITDFFFSAPIIRLIPFLRNVEVNLQEYSTVIGEIKAHQLKNLSLN